MRSPGWHSRRNLRTSLGGLDARAFVWERWLDIAIVLLSPPFILPLRSPRSAYVVSSVSFGSWPSRVDCKRARAARPGVKQSCTSAYLRRSSSHRRGQHPRARAGSRADGLRGHVVGDRDAYDGDISPATFEGRILAAFLSEALGLGGNRQEGISYPATGDRVHRDGVRMA